MDKPSSIWDYTESNVLERIPDKRGERRLLGESSSSSNHYWIALERIKRLVRSMIKEVDDVIEQGNCLPRFDHKDWEVTPTGFALFKGLRPVRRTDEQVVQNFDDLHGIIKCTIFRNFTIQEIPPDFMDLLYWMKHKPLKNRYLMRNYAALIPLENRLLFFIRAYEHINFYLEATDPEMKERIMKRLPYSSRWYEMLKGNHLLEHHFNYKIRDTSGAEALMDYYRDSNAHRMDQCFQIVEVGGYEASEHDLLFLVKYPKYLTMIQEFLHDEKQLEKLKPHLLFSIDQDILPSISSIDMENSVTKLFNTVDNKMWGCKELEKMITPGNMRCEQANCRIVGNRSAGGLSEESQHSKREDFSKVLRRMEVQGSDSDDDMYQEEKFSLEESGLSPEKQEKTDNLQKRKNEWGPIQRIPKSRRFAEDGKTVMQRAQEFKSSKNLEGSMLDGRTRSDTGNCEDAEIMDTDIYVGAQGHDRGAGVFVGNTTIKNRLERSEIAWNIRVGTIDCPWPVNKYSSVE